MKDIKCLFGFHKWKYIKEFRKCKICGIQQRRHIDFTYPRYSNTEYNWYKEDKL